VICFSALIFGLKMGIDEGGEGAILRNSFAGNHLSQLSFLGVFKRKSLVFAKNGKIRGDFRRY
jgi:hypothetical protein